MVEGNRFDRVAPIYDLAAGTVFGGALGRAQVRALNWVPEGSRVLVFGGGSGRILHALGRRRPASVVWIDASAAMLARARRRRPSGVDIRFVHGDERSLAGLAAFDRILAPFVLDCFRPPRAAAVLRALLSSRTADGRLLVVDFVAESRWQRALVATMIAFFRRVAALEAETLPPWQRLWDDADLVTLDRFDAAAGAVRAWCLQPRSESTVPRLAILDSGPTPDWTHL